MKSGRRPGAGVAGASLACSLTVLLTAGGLTTGCVGRLEFDPNAATPTGSGGRLGAGSGGLVGTAGVGGSINGTGGATPVGSGSGGTGTTGGGSGGSPSSGGATATGGSGAAGPTGTGGAPAGTGGSGAATMAGSGGAAGGSGAIAAACPAGFDVLDTIFNKKCGGCHGATAPSKNLDLVSTGLGARLVNKVSSCKSLPFISSTLNAKGAAVGYFMDKLLGPVVGCGSQMPPGAAPLTATEMACVNDWAVLAIARQGSGQ